MTRSGIAAAISMALAAHAATLAHLPNTAIDAGQVDAAGNIYIAGSRGTLGTLATYDALVSKFSPDGSQVLYTATLGGSQSDGAVAIALDAAGNAYVLGQTQSTDFPATSGTGQGFVAKLNPQGKVVYATLFGGTANITPNPGGLAVDAAGDVYASGLVNGTGFPAASGAPFTSADVATFFVVKLDASGNVTAGIRGLGGKLALDGQGNVYMAGVTYNVPSSIPVTQGAFQTSFSGRACTGTGQLGIPCSYQYVAKVNGALTQISYVTYLTGTYGATPAAISVDAQGQAMVAGTTNSPDYPTTGNTFQPVYIANAPPGPNTNLFFTIYPPPASGFVTKLNAGGTGLVYSTLYSGTVADTITFAAFTSGGTYLAGQAGSPDLPGLDGVPAQCLPETYVTRMSTDATSAIAARIAGSGNVLAYDATTSTLIAWDGANLTRFDPSAPPPAISCILDSADLKPVSQIAPGELLSIFGPHFVDAGNASSFSPPFPTTLNGLSGSGIAINGVASPLLYVSPQQINIQVPFEIAGAAQANLSLKVQQTQTVTASAVLPVVAANPAAFLDTVTVLNSLNSCSYSGAQYSGTPLPLAFNSDGSRNTCRNQAPHGTPVRIFLNGLGVVGQAATGALHPSPGAPLPLTITATEFGNTTAVTVVSATAAAGSIDSVWQVDVQLTNQDTGAIPISLSVDLGNGVKVPVRDANLTIWVKYQN